VLVAGGASGNGIYNNAASGNHSAGVELRGPSTSGNVVAGNLLGTDAVGATAVPDQVGLLIGGGASGNLVGGTAAASANVLAGNTLFGALITGPGTSGNVLQQDFDDPDKRTWEALSARQKGHDPAVVEWLERRGEKVPRSGPGVFCWVRLDKGTVLAFGLGPWGLPGERALTLEEACAEHEAATFPADGQLPRSLQYRFDYGRLWEIPPEKPPPTGWLVGTAERSLADMALLLDIHGIKHSDCDRAVFFDPPGEDKEQELLRDGNPEREFWRHHELGPRLVAYRLHPETGPPPPLEMEVRADRFARTARRAGLTARWVTRHIASGP
jgi:hypothetical protein